MTTSAKAKRKNSLSNFRLLKKYMASVSRGRLGRHKIFSLCVKSSVSKCFEFNLAIPAISKTENCFFAISSLRGICEDLIVLRFISTLPQSDREQLMGALYNYELSSRIRLQEQFFDAFRPQQPVLRWRNPDQITSASEAAARAIWNKHGWPGMSRGAMPQIRQIAEKQGADQLAILYDYLYRLTSGGVHFNVQSLLRAGWGHFPEAVFSTKNFHPYFAEYCALYGAFMFCLYFEFFAKVLRPTSEERLIIDEIRKSVLFSSRWPEMVTFEEMNRDKPKVDEVFRMIVSAFQAVSRKRLISKSVNYKNKRSAELKQIRKLLSALNSAFVSTAGSETETRSKDRT